jgi:hypothetical protein
MIRRLAATILCAASLLVGARSQTQTPARPAQQNATAAGASDLNSKKDFSRTPLDAAAEAEISATIGQDDSAYHFVAQREGFRSQNPAQGLAAEFTKSGVAFRAGGVQWTMALHSYGYGKAVLSAAPAAPHASANRLQYERFGMTESYVNGPTGLEQAFIIGRALGKATGEPLTVTLSLSGDLSASVDPGARSLTLKKNGVDAVRYGGLRATDAAGRELPASIELASNEVRLRVDDKGAQYPITIDPMVQLTKLNNSRSLCSFDSPCDVGGPGDQFGYSVSVSSDGNTIAAAAPVANGTNAGSGAVYVFQKAARYGWGPCILVGCHDFVAKLTPGIPGTVQQSGFGWGVAMSGDASTIAVLLGGSTPPNVSSFPDLIYVYVRPSTGWASTGTINAYLALDGFPSEDACQNNTNPAYCTASFPSSLAINGDGSAVVMGYSGGIVNNLAQGAAYVFVRPSGGWSNQDTYTAKLTASDGSDLALLGYAVAFSSDGSTIVATAPDARGYAGAAYVYVQPSGGWTNATQNAELTSATIGFLGNSVGITANGQTVVVGGSGKALIFYERTLEFCTLQGNCSAFHVWENTQESAQLSGSDQPIGRVRISGDESTIVAAGLQNLLQNSAGSVYLFARPANGWLSATESQKVSASDAAAGDNFGADISLSNSGTIMVVGAPGATMGSNLGQGATYVMGGYAGTATASVSPSSLGFGSQTVGTVSASQQVTISNVGNGSMHISGVAATANFTTTQNCLGAALASGASCSEQVSFAPTSVGGLSGTLTFTDDSGGSAGATQSVQLTGSSSKATTTTAITLQNPNPSYVGQAVSVGIQVSPEPGVLSLVPSGTVTAKANTGETCTTTAPYGICSLTFTTAGSRTIGATYNGDANFLASTAIRTLQAVKKYASTTTVASSLNPSTVGQAVTFTASVSSTGPAIPDGETITFKYGTTVLGTAPTTSGSASITVSTLPAGSDSIVAAYAGDVDFAASSGAVKQVVNKFATTTINTSSLNPSTVGQAVTFTATVSSTGGAIPDGDGVTFKYGTTVLGTATTTSGSASITVATLPAGSDSIVAAFAGDPNFAASTGAVKQVVNKFATTVMVSSLLNPSTVAQAVMFTATVSSSGGAIPDGETITFKYGTTVLGTGTTSAGAASLSVSTLPAGSDSVIATYAGDPNFAVSSGSIKQVVNKFATTTMVTSSPNPSTLGSTVTLTATVSSGGGAIPDGETVTFKYGNTVLGTATTLGGSASLNVTTLPSGSDTVVGTYAGDAKFAASSGLVVQKVQ